MTIQPCRETESCAAIERATVTMRGVLVDRTQDTGIFMGGSSATIEASVVRNTTVSPANEHVTAGIMVQSCAEVDACVPMQRGDLILRGSLVEDNVHVGVFAVGSDAVIEGTHVRRTVRRSPTDAGHGVHAQVECQQIAPELVCDPNTRANLTFAGSRIEETDDLGLAIVASDASIAGLLIERTRALDGILGDGVLVYSEVTPATLHVTSSLIAQSDRAGVANFGGSVSLGDLAIACAAIDLDGEHLGPLTYAFEDRGSNTCGCPTANGACKLVSSGLVPPAALSSPE